MIKEGKEKHSRKVNNHIFLLISSGLLLKLINKMEENMSNILFFTLILILISGYFSSLFQLTLCSIIAFGSGYFIGGSSTSNSDTEDQKGKFQKSRFLIYAFYFISDVKTLF